MEPNTLLYFRSAESRHLFVHGCTVNLSQSVDERYNSVEVVALIGAVALLLLVVIRGYSLPQVPGDIEIYGPINPSMVCPHCQATGMVHARRIRQKKGISGGKATGALLTGGWSVLATGLSR